MGLVTKSQKQNITSPSGNSLALFVDGDDGVMKIKDIRGNIQKITDYVLVPPTLNYGLFSQIENSVPITGTIEESSLIGNGVGSISVPANSFSIGDSFEANLIGEISCVNIAQLDIKIQTSTGVLLADTQVINMSTATNKKWRLNIVFTIRNVGSEGVASIVSGGLFSYNKDSGTNFEGTNFSIINNSTFDTTIDNTLLITAKWNTDNVGNSIYSQFFTLNKIF